MITPTASCRVGKRMQNKQMTKQEVINYIKNCELNTLSISNVAAASGKTEATIKRHFIHYIDTRLGKASKGQEYTIDDLMDELKWIRKELADLKKTVKTDPASWIYPDYIQGMAEREGDDISFLYEDGSISSVRWQHDRVPSVVVINEQGYKDRVWGKKDKNGNLVRIIAYKVVGHGTNR